MLLLWSFSLFSLWHVSSQLGHVGSSSLTRDRTRIPCTGSTKSQPLDHQGGLWPFLDCLFIFTLQGPDQTFKVDFLLFCIDIYFPPNSSLEMGCPVIRFVFRVNVLGSPSLAVFLLLRQSISVLELVAGGIPCSSPVSRLPPNCPLLSGAPLLSRLPLGLYASRSGAW